MGKVAVNRIAVMVMFLVVVAHPAAAGELCKPEARKLLPAAEEFAKLCPAEKVFVSKPREEGNPEGGCTLYFDERGVGFVQISVSEQRPSVAGGPKVGAQKAAEQLVKLGMEEKLPAVKKVPWKSIEAYELEGTPGYYVAGKGGEVWVVQVNEVAVKAPGAACKEAITAAVVKRLGGK